MFGSLGGNVNSYLGDTAFQISFIRGKFEVRTDHAALIFLHQFSDEISRLIRWSVRLAEFEILLLFKSGNEVPHVEALSSHMKVIKVGGILIKQSGEREEGGRIL